MLVTPNDEDDLGKEEDFAATEAGANPIGFEELPLKPWEVVGARKTIPEDLRQLIGAPTRFLRVSRAVHHKVLTRHARDIPYYERLDELFQDWNMAGSSAKYSNKWDVLMRVDKRWILAVIGRDAGGSYILVTLFTGRDQYMLKRIEQGRFRRRE
jgi:hypothetical protein